MRIVIGLDASDAAEAACRFVASRSWPSGTCVTLVSAVESVGNLVRAPSVPDQAWRSRHRDLELLLDDRASALRRCGLVVSTDLLRGDAADALQRVADELLADLIVVGSRGRGPIASAVLGSVSAHLVDHAVCPVLVVRAPSASRMLLATDGTESSHRIPSVLASWDPAFRGLPVEVISVSPTDPLMTAVTPWALYDETDDLAVHQEIAEQVADEMLERGWLAAADARAGDPARQILSVGREWGADLIVTGSRGIGTFQRIARGSVAHDVLVHSRSSVLVMRGLVPSPRRRPAVAPSAASVN